MLATLNETETGTNRRLATMEYIINNHYTSHWSIWDKNELITNLFGQRDKIHSKKRADSREAKRHRPRCNKGCDGSPGICAKSLGSMAIMDCEN